MAKARQTRRSAFTVKSGSIKKELKANVTITYRGKSKELLALWDTGANCSCISEETVRDLGMIPTGFEDMMTPTGKDTVGTYLVDVLLPNNVSVHDLKVCDSKIGAQGIGMLVGMDIISKGDFAVSNYQGKTIFSFRMPSIGAIDFVRDIKVEKVVGPMHGKGKRKNKK